MECKDIQERLSAYIDGIIPAEDKAFIDKHLKSCQRCSETFSELKKTVEHLRKLEEIKPPSWLAQKIMAKIKKEAEPQKGILQKLFYPLHIKLPIEAIATIFIAVTAVYLYKAIEPQKKLAQAPIEVIARNEGDEAISKDKTAKPLAHGDKKEEKPAIKESETAPAKEAVDKTDRYKEAPAAPAEIAKKEKAIKPAGASVKEEKRREAAVTEPEIKKTLADKKEDVINITISVKNIETASKEIEKIMIQLKGRIIKKEPSENKKLITAELDAKKVKELLEKLKSIGKIKKKIEVLEKHEEVVKIKIEIVI